MSADTIKWLDDAIEAEQRRMNNHKFIESLFPMKNLREKIQEVIK